MSRDIRELFKDNGSNYEKMAKNHETRFLDKLETALPKAKHSKFNSMHIAASLVFLMSLGFGAYTYLYSKTESTTVVSTPINKLETKTLGDISPGLKKVEDYYLASINLQLSKVKYTPETKDVFDGYLKRLDELDKEYKRLSIDLAKSKTSELTVNALIDNLKLRLNLMYRLQSQLKELDISDNQTEKEQSI